MPMIYKSLKLSLLASMTLVGSAAASPFDPVQLMREYNTIALGNATVKSETEGTVFVGGNLIASPSYVVNSDNLPSGILGCTLVVGGDMSGQTVKLQNGNAIIGGSQAGLSSFVTNNGATVAPGVVNVAGVQSSLTGFSQALSLLPNSGVSKNSNGQNGSFAVNTPLDLAVLNVSDTLLSSFSSLNFNSVNVATVINVSGTTIDLSSGFNFNSFSTSGNVLFNFFEATSVELGTFSA